MYQKAVPGLAAYHLIQELLAPGYFIFHIHRAHTHRHVKVSLCAPQDASKQTNDRNGSQNKSRLTVRDSVSIHLRI